MRFWKRWSRLHGFKQRLTLVIRLYLKLVHWQGAADLMSLSCVRVSVVYLSCVSPLRPYLTRSVSLRLFLVLRDSVNKR